MGTRSLTHFQDDAGATLATLYRQYDGYPEGHGADLAALVSGRGVTNGFGEQKAGAPFNGAGDMAVRVIAGLKMAIHRKMYDYKKGRLVAVRNPQDVVGELYLVSPGTADVGEEWTYTVRAFRTNLRVTVCEGTTRVFEGHEDGFKAWCDERTAAAEARRAARAVA